ncbi:hypothetical protein ACFOED_09155 [Vulcaniibacterium thermophilum]|uniref:Uncharacterized protein n=1 Tax=Vulcaniibacterium thermophilum TaxID=1169913 RepID=A0A918ZBN7_9GAMM|nr:hypothetical protein [Vulcaniibacterium thermophilum]GHE42184.1 hypothetical protein GCM10007167_25060 [Vulcaniibacterium thermophilum]
MSVLFLLLRRAIERDAAADAAPAPAAPDDGGREPPERTGAGAAADRGA